MSDCKTYLADTVDIYGNVWRQLEKISGMGCLEKM